MRSLLIPAGLIACGVLAALPFRRSPAPPLADNLSPPPAEAAGLPDTVTPLRELPLSDSAHSSPVDNPPRVRSRFASTPLPAVSPYEPAIERLPSSYQEVAIPLALPADPSNLLRPTPEAEGSGYKTPGLSNPEPTAIARHTMHRFGIPEETAEGWRPEQAIPETASTSGLASVLEREPEPSRVSEPANPPQNGSLPPGRFQTVSETRAAPPKPSPPELHSPEPAPRQRMFIREPQ